MSAGLSAAASPSKERGDTLTHGMYHTKLINHGWQNTSVASKYHASTLSSFITTDVTTTHYLPHGFWY